MVASVRKSSETRAVIEVEKKGWTKYVAEGDLLQRNYAVTQNGKQVAQVYTYMSLSTEQQSVTSSKGCLSFNISPLHRLYLLACTSAHI